MIGDAAADSDRTSQSAGSTANSGGASQPAGAMQPLGVLNKSSSRLATFLVRACGGRVVEYTYKNKKDNQEVKAQKFEAYLVGQNPQHYCIGYVKNSLRVCEEAMRKYQVGTHWALSKVAFDTYGTATYISTPIPFRVDLAKSNIIAFAPSQEVSANMAEHPVPPRSVAEVARITTNRSTDLIAVVKDVSSTRRRSKTDEEIVDVELVDNSTTTTGKLATIVVSVFGNSKIRQLSGAVGTPMAFYNLSVACSRAGAKPTINHYGRELVVPAPECGKTLSLREKQQDLTSATHTEKLSAVYCPNCLTWFPNALWTDHLEGNKHHKRIEKHAKCKSKADFGAIEIPKLTALLIEQSALLEDAVATYMTNLYSRAALRSRL